MLVLAPALLLGLPMRCHQGAGGIIRSLKSRQPAPQQRSRCCCHQPCLGDLQPDHGLLTCRTAGWRRCTWSCWGRQQRLEERLCSASAMCIHCHSGGLMKPILCPERRMLCEPHWPPPLLCATCLAGNGCACLLGKHVQTAEAMCLHCRTRGCTRDIIWKSAKTLRPSLSLGLTPHHGACACMRLLKDAGQHQRYKHAPLSPIFARRAEPLCVLWVSSSRMSCCLQLLNLL